MDRDAGIEREIRRSGGEKNSTDSENSGGDEFAGFDEFDGFDGFRFVRTALIRAAMRALAADVTLRIGMEAGDVFDAPVQCV